MYDLLDDTIDLCHQKCINVQAMQDKEDKLSYTISVAAVPSPEEASSPPAHSHHLLREHWTSRPMRSLNVLLARARAPFVSRSLLTCRSVGTQ
jgi:hypothetical protein